MSLRGTRSGSGRSAATGRLQTRAPPNPDLWLEVGRLWRLRRRRIIVTTAESHVEWRELAQGMNVLMREYHYFSKPYLMCPCCWISCQIYAYQHGDLVSEAAVNLPIARRLAARGIHLQWTPSGEGHGQGGLIITLSAVPVPQDMQRDASPGV